MTRSSLRIYLWFGNGPPDLRNRSESFGDEQAADNRAQRALDAGVQYVRKTVYVGDYDSTTPTLYAMDRQRRFWRELKPRATETP